MYSTLALLSSEWLLRSFTITSKLPVAFCPPLPLSALDHFGDGSGSEEEDLEEGRDLSGRGKEVGKEGAGTGMGETGEKPRGPGE